MGLIDDVDLVAAADRCEERAFAQVTGVVDTTVAGRVDLDDVHTARPATGKVAAALAFAAGIGDRSLFAIERAGEDAGARGLAAAARSGEQIGVVDPVGGEGVAQGLGDVILTDDFGEGFGSVSAIKGQGCIHGMNPNERAGH